MGLDMYLNKHYYQSRWGANGQVKRRKKINGLEVKEVICEAMYWRKSNQIHSWFVYNVQKGVDDCNEYPVSREQLKELLGTVSDVLKTRNHSALETKSGFFFGSMDYDEWYWGDLERTLNDLSALLKNDDGEGWFTYQASW